MEDVSINEIIDSNDPAVFTVSQITRDIKRKLEGSFSDIWIQGEVTNYKHHQSGHRYFSLKDDKAVIQATLFRQYGRLVKFDIEDGLEVKVHGSVSVYPPRGQYQIKVDYIEPVGKGALQLAFEQLCQRLKAEGIFDKEKKPIPTSPRNVGVITSETGAALQDILRVTKERNASFNIYIFPARVQGDIAPKEIAESIRIANKIANTDVLIVGRGGGSIEDLWAFNDPEVAYAIFDSKIPVISAVGHEINYSISDMVADMYVSTPSAAATFVCKSLEEFDETLKSYKNLFESRIKSKIDLYKSKIENYSVINLNKRFNNYIINKRNILKQHGDYINNSIERIITKKKNQLSNITNKIVALNPLTTLERGFSLTQKNNEIVRSAKSLSKDDIIVIKFKDGEVRAKVI